MQARSRELVPTSLSGWSSAFRRAFLHICVASLIADADVREALASAHGLNLTSFRRSGDGALQTVGQFPAEINTPGNC